MQAAAYSYGFKNGEFGKVGATNLKQRSGAEAAHVTNMGDAGSFKDVDADKSKNSFLNSFEYKAATFHSTRATLEGWPRRTNANGLKRAILTSK